MHWNLLDIFRRKPSLAMPPMREVTRLAPQPALPPAAPEPTPAPERKDEAAWAKYIVRGGIHAEVNALMAALALRAEAPNAVQDIIQRGVATCQEQEQRHCLWQLSQLPLPTNPFVVDSNDAWDTEIARQLRTSWRHAGEATHEELERRASRIGFRLEIALIVPDTLAWRRFRLDCNHAQRARLAHIIAMTMMEVMGFDVNTITPGIETHVVEDLSSYGWSFGLYDDADDTEGLVA